MENISRTLVTIQELLQEGHSLVIIDDMYGHPKCKLRVGNRYVMINGVEGNVYYFTIVSDTGRVYKISRSLTKGYGYGGYKDIGKYHHDALRSTILKKLKSYDIHNKLKIVKIWLEGNEAIIKEEDNL